MDPAGGFAQVAHAWLPRASGDGPALDSGVVVVGRAAPRERGWTHPPLDLRQRSHGCPARAGMDPLESASGATRARLPRASGDGP